MCYRDEIQILSRLLKEELHVMFIKVLDVQLEGRS